MQSISNLGNVFGLKYLWDKRDGEIPVEMF